MDSPSPSLRRLARQLLALEAARPGDPAAHAQEAVRVCEKLRVSLTRFAGPDGFAALLRRSLVLAGEEVPSLGQIKINPDCVLEGLEALAADEADGGAGAAGALTAHLLGLLVILVGQPLTLRLVRESWPEATLDE